MGAFFIGKKEKKMEKEVNNPEVIPSDEGGQGTNTPEPDDTGQEKKGTGSGEVEEPEKGSTTEEGKEKGKGLPKDYDGLRAEYTRRTQEWSKKEKELAGLSRWKTDLEASPQFQQWTEDMQRLAKMQAGKQPDFESMSDEEKFNYMVDQRVNEILNQKVQPYIDATTQQSATAKVDKFIADNPEAKNHVDNIVKEMEAGLSMEKAWKLVKADFAKDDAKQEVLQEMETKKNANLQLPGKQPSTPAKGKKMTVEEAAELASRQIGQNW